MCSHFYAIWSCAFIFSEISSLFLKRTNLGFIPPGRKLRGYPLPQTRRWNLEPKKLYFWSSGVWGWAFTWWFTGSRLRYLPKHRVACVTRFYLIPLLFGVVHSDFQAWKVCFWNARIHGWCAIAKNESKSSTQAPRFFFRGSRRWDPPKWSPPLWEQRTHNANAINLPATHFTYRK